MDQDQQPAAVLQAKPAVMTAQISITRAGTGKVEHYDLTFTPLPEPTPQEKEPQ